LTQIAKPGNSFLRVIWTVFVLVAIGGSSILIYMAVDQYLQFDVFTMTKIKRETEITLPAVTFCCSSGDYKSDCDMHDMIDCGYGGADDDCKTNNVTVYSKKGFLFNCVQYNYGTENAELQKAVGEGSRYGYFFLLYNPRDSYFKFALTDNSARVVYDDLRESVYPGKDTDIVLTKTVQTFLGLPYSKCNESRGYRQINCDDDCYNKAMTEICGCGFPAECGNNHWTGNWTEECRSAHAFRRSEIKSHCNKECPAECNQVHFPFDRRDPELDIDQFKFDSNKRIVSTKFHLKREDKIKKKITLLSIYFDKLEINVITQSPSMSSTNLFANVGGLLGSPLHSIFSQHTLIVTI